MKVNEDHEAMRLRIRLLAALTIAREAIDALERGPAITMAEREGKVRDLRQRLEAHA